MSYPLKFIPCYFEKIWGGRAIAEKYGREIPPGKIGEAWEISDHPHGVSIVANGPLAGLSLRQVVENHGLSLYGANPRPGPAGRFPLLVKTIDANDNLSVQVHPDDAFALKNEKDPGKTEMWYVLDASPRARLVAGLKPGVTRDELAAAIRTGRCEDLLNYTPVSAGDVLHIPSGMVHALGAGVLIAEIQQNSDLVYRLYDYNRVDESGRPRPLHIDKALEAAVFPDKPFLCKNEPLLLAETSGYHIKVLDACKYFVVEEWDISSSLTSILKGKKFLALYTTRGEGAISTSSHPAVPFKANDCLLLPADLGPYTIEGRCGLLVSYIPASLSPLVDALRKAGYSAKQISSLGGPYFGNDLLSHLDHSP